MPERLINYWKSIRRQINQARYSFGGLGSAPGSWSQVAAKLVGKTGAVFALDILPMDAIEGVSFIQGDFREDAVLEQFEALLDNRPLDLVNL